MANGTPTRGGAALDTGLPEIEYGEADSDQTGMGHEAHLPELRRPLL